VPSKIAMVAGTAPFSLTIRSTSFAVSKFWGYGIPTNKSEYSLNTKLWVLGGERGSRENHAK